MIFDNINLSIYIKVAEKASVNNMVILEAFMGANNNKATHLADQEICKHSSTFWVGRIHPREVLDQGRVILPHQLYPRS